MHTNDLHMTLLALMGWITSSLPIGTQGATSGLRTWRARFTRASSPELRGIIASGNHDAE
jgi:hypothetical protein